MVAMDSEVMRRAERILWIWTGGEVFLLLVVGWLLWGSLFGGSAFLATVPRPLRLAGLAFVAVQLLIPLWVLVDLRWHDDDPSYLWVHVAAMPILNVFGLFGYVEGRRRSREE